eukprot:COSAG02_NODE_9456_length_2210_cov_1.730459_2_plen_48_part_01
MTRGPPLDCFGTTDGDAGLKIGQPLKSRIYQYMNSKFTWCHTSTFFIY